MVQFKRSVTNPTVPSLQPGEPGYTEAVPGVLHIGRSTGTNDVLRSFTDIARTKLDGIEDGATADMTGAEIATALDGEANRNPYTDAEKAKLAGLEEGKFKGRYTAADFPAALAALTAAYPSPTDGSTAEISDGTTVKTAVWDGSAWVEDPAATPGETAASIKTKYESNADVNQYTDAEKTKLAGIEATATADQTGAEIVTLIGNESDANLLTDAQVASIASIVTTHVGLSDTPDATTMGSSKGYLLAVNAAGTAVEYVASVDGGTF